MHLVFSNIAVAKLVPARFWDGSGTLISGIWASEPHRAWRMTQKAGPDRVKLNRDTHTSKKWVAKVEKVAKVVSTDSG